MLTAGVAVDKATLDFDKIFSYAVPDNFRNTIQRGSIVLVPFGAGSRPRLGIVLSLGDAPENGRLKEIIDVKNEDSVITDYTFSLIEHLKESTFCTWYEAVKTVVPYGALYKIKNGSLVRSLVRYRQTVYTARPFDEEKLKTDKQKKMYKALQGVWLTQQQRCRRADAGPSVLANLVKAGALTTGQEDKRTTAYSHIKKCRDDVELSPQQQKVYDDICRCEDSKPHLIYGVTSSGKSMVFIKLIKHALQSGQSAMVLVPEISLTPQMIRLVKEFFGDTVSVIHSRLSATERLLQYNIAVCG